MISSLAYGPRPPRADGPIRIGSGPQGKGFRANRATGIGLNYVPIVLGDLCGSRTEELHERASATLQETGEVIVTSMEKILALLEPGKIMS